MSKIVIGDEVQCIITGYSGITTAKVQYLNGEIEYAVTPASCKDEIYPKAEYISETRLRRIGAGVRVPQYKRELGFQAPRSNKK